VLIVDGHEDLAFNTLFDGRDYLRSAYDIRADEVGGPVPDVNGTCMLGLPEWLRGGVGVVIATLFAIPHAETKPGEAGYWNPEAAFQQALAQLNIYRRWAEIDQRVRVVTDRKGLDEVLVTWEAPGGDIDRRVVGLVVLIENADVIRDPGEARFWYEQGVRLIGPAWHSNRYSGSYDDERGLTDLGRDLLDEMDRLGMALDVTHMSDAAARESLARFSGPVVASHSNPRRLVPSPRQLPDDVIRSIAERDGMIGLMPLNWALDPNWRDHRDKSRVRLDSLVAAIDAIRELTGGTDAVGLGTDFDGGQGAEAAPAELDTIADLPEVASALVRRGYDFSAVEGIMGSNWLRFLRRCLSDAASR
jgi:membrane dipeptidase